jgi:outer membrane protein TolC
MSRLFKTGGRLTVDLLNSIMLYYSGRPELSFSRISGSLVQPLLRGFGRNNADVEALTQAERNMAYAVRTYSLYQDQFALGIANDYFRLLQQKDTIRNGYTNYLRRVESTRRLEARGVDRETKTSVDQARQAELTAKDSYVNAIASYRNSLDQFKITLGLPLGEGLFLDDTALDEVEQTGLVPAPLDSDVAYHLAVQKQLQVLNYIDQFEDSKRKARIAADQLKPRLDLTGDASLQSEGTDYTRFNPDQVAASVGLQLDLPLDRIPRGNAYRAALVTFESDLRAFTRRLDDLKSSIENGVRTLDQRRQNYIIQTNALALADSRVASTILSQRAGRAEVRDLNDALDAEVQAQNQVTAALVNYQQGRLQLMLAIGALDTERPKFWLKDHLTGFLPGTASVQAQATPAGEGVLPPEEYFKK